MKDKFIKYNIEDIINQKLYEEKIIDENTYKLVKNEILKKIHSKSKGDINDTI